MRFCELIRPLLLRVFTCSFEAIILGISDEFMVVISVYPYPRETDAGGPSNLPQLERSRGVHRATTIVKMKILALLSLLMTLASTQEVQGPRTSLSNNMRWEFSGCISPAANATRQCINAQGGTWFGGSWEYNMDTSSELDCPEGTRGVWCSVKSPVNSTVNTVKSSASSLSAFLYLLFMLY